MPAVVPAIVVVVVATAIMLWPRHGILLGRTNLLLIVIDTLRADRLGCYGYLRPTSQNIDRIAAGGVLFETVVANSSWTRPSVASMITGVFPRRTGVFKEKFDVLAPDTITLAEMFAERGYLTLGATANPNIDPVFGFDRGFDRFVASDSAWDWMMEHVGLNPGEAPGELPDAHRMTNAALELLEDVGDRPFFLQLLYLDPHTPYTAPAHFDHPLNRSPSTTSDRYDAEVAYVDHEVGRLVSTVVRRHPDTLIVVTSDHGEGLGDHPGLPNASIHGYTLYDSVLLVPLVFHHPDLHAPARFEPMVQLLDLVPTIAELFDFQAGEGLDGTSLASALVGGPPPELPDHVFSETLFRVSDKISVREESLKLVVNRDHLAWRAGRLPKLGVPGAPAPQGRQGDRRAIETVGPRELYRVPGREHPRRWHVNLADDVDSIRRLEAAIDDFEARVPSRTPIGRDGVVTISETVRRQLEGLGYFVDAEADNVK